LNGKGETLNKVPDLKKPGKVFAVHGTGKGGPYQELHTTTTLSGRENTQGGEKERENPAWSVSGVRDLND